MNVAQKRYVRKPMSRNMFGIPIDFSRSLRSAQLKTCYEREWFSSPQKSTIRAFLTDDFIYCIINHQVVRIVLVSNTKPNFVD